MIRGITRPASLIGRCTSFSDRGSPNARGTREARSASRAGLRYSLLAIAAVLLMVLVRPAAAGKAGTWTQLSYTTSLWGAGFQAGTYDFARRRFYYLDPTKAGRMWEFDLATNTWSQAEDLVTNPGPAAHNCSLAYEDHNDRVWLSACAPQPTPGGYWWDVKTKKFTRYVPTIPAPYCPISTVTGYDRARKQVLCAGGWANQLRNVWRLDVTQGTPTWHVISTGSGPVSFGSVNIRLSQTRGGIDGPTGRIWFVDDPMDLWWFDPAKVKWTRVPTTGDKPVLWTVMGYDPSGPAIVGWAGVNMDTNVFSRQTYLLDLTTNIWRLGPGGTAGTPTASTVAGAVAYTDEAGRRAFFHISTGPTYLWAYQTRASDSPVSVAPPAPAPAAQAFDLVLRAEGAGTVGSRVQGSTAFQSPGGRYPPGTAVRLAATPVGSGRLDRLTGDTLCGDRLVMPAHNIECRAVFTAQARPASSSPAPPSSGTTPLQTFYAVPGKPLLEVIDKAVWCEGCGSKHLRWAYDTKRKLACTGFGDYGPSRNPTKSQNVGVCYNPTDESWFQWTGFCRPKREGIMPGQPDEVNWIYDSKRHWFWLMAGLLQAPGHICRDGSSPPDVTDGATYVAYSGLFAWDIAANKGWQLVDPNAAAANLHSGAYDSVRDELLFMEGKGSCGYRVGQISLARALADRSIANAATYTDLCGINPMPYPGSGPKREFWVASASPSRNHFAWNNAGRTAYFYVIWLPHINGSPYADEANSIQNAMRITFYSFHADTRKITRLANPPNHKVETVPVHASVTNPKRAAQLLPWANSDAGMMMWDSVNKRVLYPFNRSHCGVIEGMYSYDPATGKWTDHGVSLVLADATKPVSGNVPRGNTGFFDPVNNYMVIGGIFACPDEGWTTILKGNHIYKWRYGP